VAYQALLFDLDNTLIDFTRSEELSLQGIHENFFGEYMEADNFKNNYHAINKALWRQVEAGRLKTADVKHERFRLLIKELRSAHDYREVAEHYENGLVEHVDWYPGVKELLTDLKENFQLGIVTNGLSSVQQAKYINLKIHELCECYVISELVGIAKPDKAIFDIALQQLNSHAHHTLMVGDSLVSDYAGAINARMDFCWINQHNASLPPNLTAPKFSVTSVHQLNEYLKI
jgi:YjjG family noncanonical pyrimidine nucleotidase